MGERVGKRESGRERERERMDSEREKKFVWERDIERERVGGRESS